MENRIRSLKVLLLFIFFIPTTAISDPSPERKIKIIYEHSPHPPYYFGSTEIPSDKPGLTIELVNEVCRRLNFTPRYQRVPWIRGLNMLDHNTADALLDVSYTIERSQFSVYPMDDGKPDRERALLEERYVFFTHDSSPPFWDGETLSTEDGPYGAIISYSVLNTLKALGAETLEIRDRETAFKLIQHERIRGFADLSYMGEFYLMENRKHYPDVIKIEPEIQASPYYLIFSREFYSRNPELCEMIWDEIKSLKQTPFYSLLKKKYKLIDE